MTNVHVKIKNLREESHLKQRQVADYLGISQQAYSYYELDKRELPSRHVVNLAKLYNVSTDYILGMEPERAGSYDLNATFVQGVQLKDVLISLRKLNKSGKADLMKYLSYLGFNHNHLIFKSSESQRIRDLVFQMLRSNQNSPKNEFYLHGLFFEFFSCLIDENAPRQQEDLSHDRETTNRYLREAIAYIQQHFDQGLRVSDLADHVAVSRGYLYQIFNETLGMSPKQYLTNFCMTRATELLTLDDEPVEVVAKKCGYPNPVAFSALFRKRMGQSPTQYRNQLSAEYRERLKKELESLQ